MAIIKLCNFHMISGNENNPTILHHIWLDCAETSKHWMKQIAGQNINLQRDTSVFYQNKLHFWNNLQVIATAASSEMKKADLK